MAVQVDFPPHKAMGQVLECDIPSVGAEVFPVEASAEMAFEDGVPPLPVAEPPSRSHFLGSYSEGSHAIDENSHVVEEVSFANASSEECDDEQNCACDGCDEETLFADVGPEAQSQKEVASHTDEEKPCSEEVLQQGSKPNGKKKDRRSSSRPSLGARLTELAKPRQPAPEPEPENPKPLQHHQKKNTGARPSLLLRLKPTNLEEAWAAFQASNYSDPPNFTYAYPEEDVTRWFEENNQVCFSLLPQAERIMHKVDVEYGGSEAFMLKQQGKEMTTAEELRDVVSSYLQEQGIEDKADIRIVDSLLSAATVVKPLADEKYIVNISKAGVPSTNVQGICDHEVGTHLLRMMNDEHQVWHGRRDRYKLANPWTTEEGFATLNTFMSMPCKLLYHQALRYFAVCRGAQVGFVELFQEIRSHIKDPLRCWQMCCRIKRGQVDTTQPGAFYLDQAYFKGAVEILRHLDEVDFGRLYGGQIALQDLDKVHFLLRKECVRLPLFLNSAEKLKTYTTYCRRLLRENQIEAAIERVCKPMFLRAANEFFKQKPKAELRSASATITLNGSASVSGCASSGPARSSDAQRLEDLARPRILALPASAHDEQKTKTRRLDVTRMTELAMPRHRVESEDETLTNGQHLVSKTLDIARLHDLARPRNVVTQPIDGTASMLPCSERLHRELNHARLLELSLPRLPRSDLDADDGGVTVAAVTTTIQTTKTQRADSAPVGRRTSRRSRRCSKKKQEAS